MNDSTSALFGLEDEFVVSSNEDMGRSPRALVVVAGVAVAAHTGPKTETDDFYAGVATITEDVLRDVSGIGAPTVGQTLCQNGKVIDATTGDQLVVQDGTAD